MVKWQHVCPNSWVTYFLWVPYFPILWYYVKNLTMYKNNICANSQTYLRVVIWLMCAQLTRLSAQGLESFRDKLSSCKALFGSCFVISWLSCMEIERQQFHTTPLIFSITLTIKADNLKHANDNSRWIVQNVWLLALLLLERQKRQFWKLIHLSKEMVKCNMNNKDTNRHKTVI